MSERPLTIMIGADTYPPDINGAAQFGQRLAHAMRDRGHSVHVVAANPNERKTLTRTVDGIVEHRLFSHKALTHPYIRICAPWDIWYRVGKILDEVQPDVVHVQCHYIIGRVLILQARRRGIRVVATNHFMPENLDPFLPFPDSVNRGIAQASWKDMRYILGQAQVVTTPTPIGAKAMKESGGFKKPVMPVSNGIDFAHYEPKTEAEKRASADQRRIFFAGRLAVEKNIDVLIEALSLLPASCADVVLEVAGTGEILDALQKKVQDCGVSERVKFLGFVSDEELRAGYLRASVFCQPGTAELQSLVSLEAMSASCPVVLANALALPHLVDEGHNGFLFEPGNATDLAAKLAYILDLPEQEREAMGERSHEMVKAHAAEKTWRTFESLYESNELYYDFVTSQAGGNPRVN